MILRLIRWWLLLVGGVLLGAGLVLHGQIAMARLVRDEVDNVFVLWRGIGRMTFFLQDDVTQTSLLLHDLPEKVLLESDRGAWILTIIGALIALSAPLLLRGGPKGSAPAGGGKGRKAAGK